MNSRNQDDLGEVPSLSIPKDDVSDHSRPSHAQVHKPVRRTPWWTMFLTLALIGVSAGGYWQITMMHQELLAARAELQETSTRLLEVSGTISATGEASARSEGEVKDELKAINFEIRKLWDLANKANKPAIEKQAGELASLSKKIAGSDASMAKLQKEVVSLATSLSSLSKEVVTTSTDLGSEASSNRDQLDRIDKSLKQLSSSSKKSIDTLTAQVKDYQDQIKAIDAHREQLTRRLSQLEGSVRSLSSAGQ